MTTTELEQGVQFTVDQNGEVTAVVVAPELWKKIVETLEDTQDRHLIGAFASRLSVGPTASGALRWRDIADEWQ